MFSIILSCVTEVPVRHGRGGGFGNCGVFLAHNYVSEQFGNYVEYGIYILCTGNNYVTKIKKFSHNVEMNKKGILHL